MTLKCKRANETETTKARKWAIWLVYWTDTNARGFWLVKRTHGWKNSMPENSILYIDVILQHDRPIEQCLQHIRVFFGGKTKSPCFEVFIHWLIKQNDEHLPKPFFKVIRKSLYLPWESLLLEVRVGWWYKIQTQVLIVGTDIKLITAKPTEITYILSRLAWKGSFVSDVYF